MKTHFFVPLVSMVWLTFGCSGPEPTSTTRPKDRPRATLDRPFLPRLSIPTVYRPCRPEEAAGALPICSPSPSSALPPPEFPLTVSTDTSVDLSGGAEPHLWALEALLRARTSDDLEEAIELFDQAISANTTPPASLLNDAGVALMARASTRQQPIDLARALELTLRANKEPTPLPAALFNQGLLCRELGLSRISQGAWRDFLSAEDPGSPWTTEAQRYLDQSVTFRLEADEVLGRLNTALAALDVPTLRELAEGYSETTGSWVVEVLFDRWSVAALADNLDEAKTLIAVSEEIVAVLSPLARRARLEKILAPLRYASHTPANRGARRALAKGHRDFAHGVRLLKEDKPTPGQIQQAADQFLLAREHLASQASPFAVEAELEYARCLAKNSAFTRVESVVTALSERDDLQGEPLIQGRAAWLQALAESQLRLPLQSIDSYRRALAHYRSADDLANLANVSTRLAESLADVGELEEAWTLRRQGLASLPLVEDPTRPPYILGEAANAVLAVGLPRVARLFQEEGVARARNSGEPQFLAESLRQLAEVDLEVGLENEALANLREAWQRIRDLDDRTLRAPVEVKLQELEGRALLAGNPAAALAKFEQGITRARGLQLPLYLSALQLERAEALLALGRTQDVRAELEVAVRVIEREWEEALKPEARAPYAQLWPTYYGSRRRPFDRLVARLVAEVQIGPALTMVEQARAREVLALLRGPSQLSPALRQLFSGPARPLSFEEVIANLPPRLLLVEYAIIEGKLLTWVLRRGRMEFFGEQPAGEELDHLVALASKRLRSADRPEKTLELLAELYSRLVAPFSAELKELDQVVFVPDGALQAVPFSALFNGTKGRFLVESHAVAVAPSATLYQFSRAAHRELARHQPLGVLAVGVPTTADAELLGLRELQSAEDEAREVSELYPSRQLLLGEAATRSCFLAAFRGHAVVHFAGHALGHPSKAALMLKPDRPGESGQVMARDLMEGIVEGQDLKCAETSKGGSLPQVVVLSACSSVGDKAAGGQSVAALVRPLIGAGIPAVVGALWPVDDLAASELTLSFHRHLLEGQDAASALRLAQIEMLKEHPQLWLRQPSSWAAFQVIGHASLRGMERKEE